MRRTKEVLAGWIELSGLPKFTTTMVPFLLGALVAWAEDLTTFNGPVLVISLLIVFLLSEFCFVLNVCGVYTDLKSAEVSIGYAEGRSTLHSTAVSGRFNAFVKGRLSVEQATIGAYLCALAAIPLGVVLQFYFNTGFWTLPLGLIGIFIAYSYSKGLRLSYHGLGELAITAGVGWLTVFSGYYVQANQVSWLPTVVSLPWVIDVFKLKLTREMPDLELDKSINRRTLAVRLGKDVTASLYLPLTICSWLSFIPILFLGLNVPYTGFVLLAFPVFFTSKSLVAIHRGEWRTKEGLTEITKNAFTGMILIPVALIGVLLLKIISGMLPIVLQ
ncbi:MAG: UbiA family prenyltransferase [Candidatus Methanospirareceae archaeon]